MRLIYAHYLHLCVNIIVNEACAIQRMPHSSLLCVWLWQYTVYRPSCSQGCTHARTHTRSAVCRAFSYNRCTLTCWMRNPFTVKIPGLWKIFFPPNTNAAAVQKKIPSGDNIHTKISASLIWFLLCGSELVENTITSTACKRAKKQNVTGRMIADIKAA